LSHRSLPLRKGRQPAGDKNNNHQQRKKPMNAMLEKLAGKLAKNKGRDE
jgi:hypothetical protein